MFFYYTILNMILYGKEYNSDLYQGLVWLDVSGVDCAD